MAPGTCCPSASAEWPTPAVIPAARLVHAGGQWPHVRAGAARRLRPPVPAVCCYLRARPVLRRAGTPSAGFTQRLRSSARGALYLEAVLWTGGGWRVSGPRINDLPAGWHVCGRFQRPGSAWRAVWRASPAVAAQSARTSPSSRLRKRRLDGCCFDASAGRSRVAPKGRRTGRELEMGMGMGLVSGCCATSVVGACARKAVSGD
jgi:hypothetical protein